MTKGKFHNALTSDNCANQKSVECSGARTKKVINTVYFLIIIHLFCLRLAQKFTLALCLFFCLANFNHITRALMFINISYTLPVLLELYTIIYLKIHSAPLNHQAKAYTLMLCPLIRLYLPYFHFYRESEQDFSMTTVQYSNKLNKSRIFGYKYQNCAPYYLDNQTMNHQDLRSVSQIFLGTKQMTLTNDHGNPNQDSSTMYKQRVRISEIDNIQIK